MKIAILGGSFDPPHIGHVLIAQQVKEYIKADQVWLMPNSLHAFGKKQTPPKIRLQMCEILENKFLKASDFEIKKGGVSYTIDTLEELKMKYPKNDFYWILGSDQLNDFSKYKKWESIINNHKLIIFPRESILDNFSDKIKKALNLKSIPNSITFMQNKDLILSNISSSMIRERIKNKLPIRYLVPIEIESFIINNKLYQ